ncbi:Efflux pump dotC [Colletotrichum siamense]|nr:Efflux pump dotC [Colletotrichum siamense]
MSLGLAAIYPEGTGDRIGISSRLQQDGDVIQPPVPSTAPKSPSKASPHETTTTQTSNHVTDAHPDLPPDDDPNTDMPKLSGTTIALTMASLCLSVALSALDMTIVTTAIPNIVASLDSVAGYIWVGSAFILGFTAVTPIWGSVADLWGRKPIILLALTIFLVGSLLCALAPHMDALIAGRAVQGVGASGMGVMVNTIICDMFSLRDRGLYLAITSIIWAIGSAVGPVLGGVFATRLDWRWCFWINLPIGGVVFVVLFFFLDLPSPNTSVAAGLKAIDWTGSLFCMGGSLMVLLALDFGDVTHPWSSATVICLIVFGLVAIGIFLMNEWKLAANPVLPLRLLSSWSKAAAYFVFAFNAFVFIGITYYLPLYSQAVLGVDALTSGLYLLPLIVSCSLSAACAGVFIQKTGRYRVLMYAAQVLLTLGTGLLINLEFERNLTKLFVFQILTGIGVGLNIEAPVLSAQAATTVRDTAAVLATMSFLRSIATAISVVVGGVIFQNQMKAGNSSLVDQIGHDLASRFDGDNASAHVEEIGLLSTDQQAPVRQAYFGALRTVWIMYVAFAGLATVLNLFVSEYHLSDERNAVVLGVDRGNSGPSDQPGQEVNIPLETSAKLFLLYHPANRDHDTIMPRLLDQDDGVEKPTLDILSLPADVFLLVTDAILEAETLDMNQDAGKGLTIYDHIKFFGKGEFWWQSLDQGGLNWGAFDRWKDLARFGATCKTPYLMVTPILYRSDTKYNYSSALMISARKGVLSGVLRSLEYGKADPNMDDHTIFFHWARVHGVSQKLPPLRVSRECILPSLTGLHLACFKDHPEIVDALLNHQADINKRAHAWCTREIGGPYRPYDQYVPLFGASALFFALKATQYNCDCSGCTKWAFREGLKGIKKNVITHDAKAVMKDSHTWDIDTLADLFTTSYMIPPLWFELEAFFNSLGRGSLLDPLVRRAVDIKIRFMSATLGQASDSLTDIVKSGILVAQDLQDAANSINFDPKFDGPPPAVFNALISISSATHAAVARCLYLTVRLHIFEIISKATSDSLDDMSMHLDQQLLSMPAAAPSLVNELGKALGCDGGSTQNSPGVGMLVFSLLWPMTAMLQSNLVDEYSKGWVAWRLRELGAACGFGLAETIVSQMMPSGAQMESAT